MTRLRFAFAIPLIACLLLLFDEPADAGNPPFDGQRTVLLEVFGDFV